MPTSIENFVLGCDTTVTGYIIMASAVLSGPFRDIRHAFEHFDKAKTETALLPLVVDCLLVQWISSIISLHENSMCSTHIAGTIMACVAKMAKQ